MNKEDFAGYLADEGYSVLEKELDLKSISTRVVEKNNGIKYIALCPEVNGKNISPSIYLDTLYKRYEEGMSLEECVKSFCDIVRQNINPEFDYMDIISKFKDYDEVKKMLIPVVINKEANTELLKEVPHVNMNDLSIVFRVYVESRVGESSSILVKNGHMESWNKSVPELYNDAVSNMDKLNKPKIQSMYEVIRGMFGEDIPVEDVMDESPMYVVYTDSKRYGASAVFCKPKILEGLAEKYGDLAILPSSIHEVIVVPTEISKGMDLSALISSVNSEELDPEEVLSDHPYYYDSLTQQITMDEPTSKKTQEETEEVSQDMNPVRQRRASGR